MRARTLSAWSPLASSLVIVAIAACTRGNAARPEAGDVTTLPDAGPSGAQPFQADPPSVYVAKVKNVLTGLAPTSDEIAAVERDPAQLGALVDAWMTLPEYEAKMRVFFELAFQQTQITTADFNEMIPNPGGLGIGPLMTPLVQNVRESFARTVLALVDEGRPFTDAFTTTSFMMTPPLMELYAFLDASQPDDGDKPIDRLKLANPAATIAVGSASGPIAWADSIDPSSPNYLHFYFPSFSMATSVQGCAADPRVYPVDAHVIHELLYGALEVFRGTAGFPCTPYANGADAQLTTADFAAWKMVTVRAPKPGEATTRFYDVDALRSANELVLTTPRVGFFSTPAFFANWQTNTSNEMRVTTNQALIVATGMQVDGTDTTSPPTTPGLDAAHAAPGSACFSCHQTLDPTRSIFQATYSYGYGTQGDMTLSSQKGLFAFRGVVTNVGSVADLGSVLATHPTTAKAWVEKLCYYVDSEACADDDPEVARLASLFQSSGWSWRALVKALVTSPVTTNATESQTASENGQVVAIARRDHLCAALDARLGLVDVCGLDAVGGRKNPGGTVPLIAAGLPSDGYGRGAPVPLLPNAPTLFYRAGTENVCEAVADMLVDAAAPPAGARTWSSRDANGAIADFVATLMGLAADDARAPEVASILQAHFTDAQQSGASATDALKSTFVTACLSPSVVAIGM
jgi:hypothetical protein